MKKLIKKVVEKKNQVMTTAGVLAFRYILMPCTAFAQGADYMKPINNLKTLFFSIIGVVGAILLGVGISNVGTALKDMDRGEVTKGIWIIAGGGLMFFGSLVLGFLTT